MLPTITERCAGFLPQTQHDRCPRRPECVRFLSRDQTLPFAWSACETGDNFVHVDTVPGADAAGYPYAAAPGRVLCLNPSTPSRG